MERTDPDTPKNAIIPSISSPSSPPQSPTSLGVMDGENGETEQGIAGSGTGGSGVKRPRVDDEFEVNSTPPPVLTARAVYNRLRRVFQKRADGTSQLDDRWNDAWSDAKGSGRQELYAMFEKVGYNTDRVYVEKVSSQNSVV